MEATKTIEHVNANADDINTNDDAIDNSKKDRLVYIDLPCSDFSPNIPANKVAAVEICKEYGDVKSYSNPDGSRHFIFIHSDIGAFAYLGNEPSSVIQIIGGWHESQCYQRIIMAIISPLILDFYSKHFTRGDTDGFRNLLRKGNDNHKCMQALKEISQTFVAVYWHEFVHEESNYPKNRHTVEVFLEFLLKKSQDDEQQKMYIDIFILGLLPSLFAFERSLRTNNAEMRLAVRKFMLPYVFARGKFNYAKHVLSEMIMVEHCAPTRVKKALDIDSFTYNRDALDSKIESINKTKKKQVNTQNFAAWGQSDVLHSNTDGVQSMMKGQTGVRQTKDDESRSKRLPDKVSDMVNCIALLSTNSPIKFQAMNNDDYEEFQGITGTKVFKAISNDLVNIGVTKIKEMLKKVQDGFSLDSIKGTSKIVAICEDEVKEGCAAELEEVE